jgi:hypothetical protein
MKKTALVFSIGFDNFVYKMNEGLFNKKFVGELQLLGLLERELGLSGEFKTNEERQAEYLEYVTKEIDGKMVFISESFKYDAIGVANELLKWRDQLKFCNWNFSRGESERLNLLSEIEENNEVSVGISDRWILVLYNLKTTTTILNIESVEVNDNLELLHPIYKQIFSLLQTKGIDVTTKELDLKQNDESNLSKIKNAIVKNETEIELDTSDKSFQVVRFKDAVIAADFLAQQLSKNTLSPVIINNNNYGLDTSFLTFGIPLSGSEINNSNPQIIQLFKLVSALLFSKVNPYNLLSLLNLPMLPFPKSLAISLSKVLINNAGIGNIEWLDTISVFKKNINTDEKNYKEKLKSIEFYIERKRTEKVSKEELINLYTGIASWSTTMLSIAKTDSARTQLSNLKILSRSFIKTIENIQENEFTARELDRITKKIYEPITISINRKEKGSHKVLIEPEQLYDNAESLVWFDFYNQNLSAAFCDFLMQSEIEELKKQKNILFWIQENQIQLQLENLQKGILKTENKLYLFIVERANGESTKEHPIFTQLSSSTNNLEDFIYDFSVDNSDWLNFDWSEPQFEQNKKITLPTACNYIEINNSALLKKRGTESYSSVNELIHNPLDWIMNYQAKITERGLGNIDELITLKGNLSHIIVQTLLEKEKQGKVDLSITDSDVAIDTLLEEFTPQIASPFFLDENTFEYKGFVTQLKKAFKVLLGIIKNNDLKYDSFEYKAEGKIASVDFAGNIDLLFYKNDLPIIIDLKWTFSTKKYTAILKEEKSIQLAMYAKLLNHSSAITAYFLLSDAAMYTTSKVLAGIGIKTVELQEDAYYVNDRINERTINSFNYRWNEFNEGKIELSEEMLIEDIEYGSNTELEDLIPLDHKDHKVKKVNPYSNYSLFKGKVK